MNKHKYINSSYKQQPNLIYTVLKGIKSCSNSNAVANYENHFSTVSKDTLVKLINDLYMCIAESKLSLNNLCELINSSYMLREIISQYSLNKGADIIITISKELKHGNYRTPTLLTTLGTFCYSASFPGYKVEKIVLDAVKNYCSPNHDEQICRLALNCVANMLMKSEICAIPMKPLLVDYLQSLSSAKRLNSIHELKLYCNVMRGLQFALPHLPADEPNKILSMYLALQKIVFLGTAYSPAISYQNDISSPALSEYSDNENYNFSEDFYYAKIKSCALLCIQNLFKKYPLFLFSFWSWLVPTCEREESSLYYNQSLIYLLLNEKSEKVKIAAATTLSVMIENSPLCKITFDECSSDYIPVSQSMKYVVENLHNILPNLIDSEQNPQLASALLRVGSVLMYSTNYSSFKNGLIKPLIKAVLAKAKSKDNNVKMGVIAALTSAFKDSNEDLKPILSVDFIQGIFYCEDFIAERLQLLAKIARSFPQALQTLKEWLKEKLSKSIANEDTRIQSCSFEVLEEYVKSDENCPMIQFLIEKVFSLIKYDDSNRLVAGLNTLSVLSSFKIISPQQYALFTNFIKKLHTQASPQPALRCAALKLIGSLAKDQAIPTDSFSTIFTFVLSLRQSTNQNVVINSSLALSFLCMSEECLKRLPEIMLALEEGKINKKEKIVSSSIISVGNLFETFNYTEIKDNVQSLLDICISGLPHKNAKVGWDACNALFKFFANPSMPHNKMSSLLIPIFLDTIQNHHNYRTRINACQLLRDYDFELHSYGSKIVSGLVSSLEVDKKLLLTEFNVLKYQRCFRQEVIMSLIYLMKTTPSLTFDFVSSLNMNLLSIYEWFNNFSLDLIKDQNEIGAVSKDEGLASTQDCIKLILDWIEETEEIHVSFGLLEEMNKLLYIEDNREEVFVTDSIICD